MAWLITLALFWAVGSCIANGIDKSNDKKYKAKQECEAQLSSVLGNIYAIAWKECMDIQFQFLKENPKIPAGETVPSYYAKVRKIRDHQNVSLQQQSVINALIDLRKHGHEVVRVLNGEAEVIPPYREYYIREEAESVRGVLPPIYGPFDVSFAAHVTDERAQAIFKKIWNKEVLGTNIVQWTKETRDYW